MERVGSTMFSLRKHISEKYGYSAQGQRRMYCHHCSRTFITLDHVNTTPRRTHLALMIDQGASLADIRKLLLLNSTGLNRELMKLSREVNYKESYQYSSASDISLSTRAFRVKFNGSNNYLYSLVTAEEQSGRVVAISTNYSPSAVESHYQYASSYEERLSPVHWRITYNARSYLLCDVILYLILIMVGRYYIKTIRGCW